MNSHLRRDLASGQPTAFPQVLGITLYTISAANVFDNETRKAFSLSRAQPAAVESFGYLTIGLLGRQGSHLFHDLRRSTYQIRSREG